MAVLAFLCRRSSAHGNAGMTLGGHDEGQTCVCVAEHRPPALELVQHHLIPIYCGGLDVPENRIFICPTTHYGVHEIHRRILAAGAVVPRLTGEPWYAYRMAVQGFQWMTERPDLMI